VRYADDLVIVCRWRSQAERALAVLRHELGAVGLQVHPDKTSIVELTHGEGFDFLGFHHRWVKAPGSLAVETIDSQSEATNTRTHCPSADRSPNRGDHHEAQPVLGRLGWLLPAWQQCPLL